MRQLRERLVVSMCVSSYRRQLELEQAVNLMHWMLQMLLMMIVTRMRSISSRNQPSHLPLQVSCYRTIQHTS